MHTSDIDQKAIRFQRGILNKLFFDDSLHFSRWMEMLGVWLTIVVLASATLAYAEDQKSVIMLGGESCMLFDKEISKALKATKGVNSLDFQSMPGHVVVIHDSKVSAEALIKKINEIKGTKNGKEGYCVAQIME